MIVLMQSEGVHHRSSGTFLGVWAPRIDSSTQLVGDDPQV